MNFIVGKGIIFAYVVLSLLLNAINLFVSTTVFINEGVFLLNVLVTFYFIWKSMRPQTSQQEVADSKEDVASFSYLSQEVRDMVKSLMTVTSELNNFSKQLMSRVELTVQE